MFSAKIILLFALLAAFALMGRGTTAALAAPNAVLTVKSAVDWIPDSCDADCTLREAIIAANATVGVQETIKFKIPANSTYCDAASLCTIKLLGALPDITDPVVIDGYSQKGAHPNTLTKGNDAVLHIVLDGTDVETSGLVLKSSNSTVKGLVIMAFGSPQSPSGIAVQSGKNTVQGNFIGTDVSGTIKNGNANGITITDDHNLIGGTLPAERNLISGNGTGIMVYGSYNAVQGNYIGTARNGTDPLGNAFAGIKLNGATHNTIGGKGAARNLIADNTDGLEIIGGASDNKILGNYIGVGENVIPLGNHWHGVQLYAYGNPSKYVMNNLIAKNVIAHNKGAGIKLGQGAFEASYGNTYSRNAIYENGNQGIENNDSLPNPNDLFDTDEGPNRGQNFPEVTTAKSKNGKTTFTGKIISAKNTTFRIEFFTNEICDNNVHGEGNKYFGAVTVTTGADGVGEYSWSKNKQLNPNYVITATATEKVAKKWRSTSEYSQCKSVNS